MARTMAPHSVAINDQNEDLTHQHRAGCNLDHNYSTSQFIKLKHLRDK